MFGIGKTTHFYIAPSFFRLFYVIHICTVQIRAWVMKHDSKVSNNLQAEFSFNDLFMLTTERTPVHCNYWPFVWGIQQLSMGFVAKGQ